MLDYVILPVVQSWPIQDYGIGYIVGAIVILDGEYDLVLELILEGIDVECFVMLAALLFDDEMSLADEVVDYEVLRAVVDDLFVVEGEDDLTSYLG